MSQLILKQELKPVCKRCSNTGRKCDGYFQPARGATTVLLVVPSDDLIGLGKEISDAVHYFSEVSPPALVNYGSHDLFNNLVLQVCHHDESIRHLVVAASALDRRQRSTNEAPQQSVTHQYHYGKALQSLALSTNPDTQIILIACLLFVICDEFQQNRFSALQHNMAGRSILADYRKHHHGTQYSSTVEEVGTIFQRLELHTGELDQETMPDYIRWPLLDERPAPSRQYFAEPVSRDQPHSPLYGFRDIGDAGACLQVLAYSCLKARPETLPPATVFHVVPDVTIQLNQWLSNFESTCSRLDANEAMVQRTQVHLLRMYHLCQHHLPLCALR